MTERKTSDRTIRWKINQSMSESSPFLEEHLSSEMEENFFFTTFQIKDGKEIHKIKEYCQEAADECRSFPPLDISAHHEKCCIRKIWFECWKDTWTTRWVNDDQDLSDFLLGGRSIHVPLSFPLDEEKMRTKIEHDIPKKWFGNGCFARLDALSPKDVCKELCFHDPSSIVSTVVKSERCREALSFCQDERVLSIRPYIHNISEMSRVFVVNFNPVAASMVGEDEIHDTRKFLEFVKEVCQKMVYRNVVMDTCWDDEKQKYKIIEFNPFGEGMSTDSGLFSWDEVEKMRHESSYIFIRSVGQERIVKRI